MPEACIFQESIIVGTSEGREEEECGFHPMLVCSCGKCREKKSSETVANTEKGADDESEEGEEESHGRETVKKIKRAAAFQTRC